MTMYSLQLGLEIQNHYERPDELQRLGEELHDIITRVESGGNYSDDEADIESLLAAEFSLSNGNTSRQRAQRLVRALSAKYPQLLLAVDARDYDGVIVWRDYFFGGKVQSVTPRSVLPDFDPDEGFNHE